MNRRVAVTGIGVVAPNGGDPETFWRSLLEGRSAVRRISRFNACRFPTRIAAEVSDVQPASGEGIDRITAFALAAAGQAVRQANLGPDARAGVVIASGLGTYGHREVFGPCAGSDFNGAVDWSLFRDLFESSREPRALERRTPGSVPTRIAQRYGFGGPVMSVMTACAGGTQAIGDALRWIRLGRADVVLAGGSDSEIYPMGLASFCLLGALSKRNDPPVEASRPFDADRDGFVIGEGAGMLVLEELEHARARGATILGEIAGFGSASDAFRVTDPHPDGDGAVAAMSRALDDARLDVSEVGYVNAHGTSTIANDRIETHAIRRVFRERADRVAASSTKSMIGHLTVAAGAVEAIATLLSLRDQKVHPTINLTRSDPECDLDYVSEGARDLSFDAALSNSFAFGGQCATLALRRFEC